MGEGADPSSALARIDLPIRDVLRFVIPGGFGAISSALIDRNLFNESLGLSDINKLVPIGFGFGLIAFIGEFHSKVWPWKKHWLRELDDIAKEITAISGRELARRERFAKPIYKLWIEAVCSPDLRGYLHYTTGLFYSTAAVSIYAMISASACLLWTIPFIIVFFLIKSFNENLFHHILNGLLWTTSFGVVSVLSYWMSRSNLKSIANEGRIAMELDDNRIKLVELARAAGQSETDSNDTSFIVQTVKTIILDLCPKCLTNFKSVKYDGIVNQLDVRTGLSSRVAHITIESENPELLNGSPNLYTGERQQMLESALAMRLCGRLNIQAVRLQISPIEEFWKNNYSPYKHRIARIELDRAIQIGIVKRDSPIDKCCLKYGIKYLLMKGRFVIGPSPGLANVVERELALSGTGLKIFDPFAGTYLVQHIVESLLPPSNTVQSHDRLDQDGNETNYDSFSCTPTQPYDLVIIDPIYEDCPMYVNLIASKIQSKKFIIQSGRTCDVGWNNKIETMLNKIGSVEKITTETYGSCIFIVTR